MTFALKVTPFSVKSLSEATVAMERFKVRTVPFISNWFLQSLFPPSLTIIPLSSHALIPSRPSVPAVI